MNKPKVRFATNLSFLDGAKSVAMRAIKMVSFVNFLSQPPSNTKAFSTLTSEIRAAAATNGMVSGIDIALAHASIQSPLTPQKIFVEIWDTLVLCSKTIVTLLSLNTTLFIAVILAAIITMPVWILVVIPVFGIFGVMLFVEVFAVCFVAVWCCARVRDAAKKWRIRRRR